LKTGFQKCPKNDHSNTGGSGIRWVTVILFIWQSSLLHIHWLFCGAEVLFTTACAKSIINYSRHPKAGPSGFRMVISRTKFGSGIQMAFKTRSEVFSASLDRFGMNKIFFMTLFFIKMSRLAPFDTRT
jgi:hypothetical protein